MIVPFRISYIRSIVISIKIETLGSGDELVILHSWSLYPDIMQRLIDDFAKNYHVTIVHLPGIGSPWQEDFDSMHDIADTIVPILPKSAILFGWSFGGLLALDIAAHHPEHVNKIIITGSMPKFYKTDDWPGIPENSFDALIEGMQKQGYFPTLRDWLSAELEHTQDQSIIDEVWARVADWKALNTDVLIKGIEIVGKTDLREATKALTIPQLYVFGAEDEATPPDAIKAIANLSPYIQTSIIPGAAHASMVTHPDLFLKVTNEFLSG